MQLKGTQMSESQFIGVKIFNTSLYHYLWFQDNVGNIMELPFCPVHFFSGDVIRVTTGSEYGYGPNWFNLTKTGQSVFYFKVQICSDAHLLLIEDNSNIDNRHYEIIISGWNNTRSAIRKTRRVSTCYIKNT